MTKLNTATVVIVDTQSYSLGKYALDRTLQSFAADEVMVFSDRPDAWGRYGVTAVETISALSDYNRIILSSLPERLQTDFALVIQFDGFAINPSAFTAQFFDFDYIGAPWAAGLIPGRGVMVGNGGFSLRSKRLIDSVARHSSEIDFDLAEDATICIELRDRLETDDKIAFAPVEVARQFSIESDRSVRVTPFGFHGLHILPMIYGDDYPVLIENLPARCLREGSYQLSNLRMGFSNLGDAAKALLERRVSQSNAQVFVS